MHRASMRQRIDPAVDDGGRAGDGRRSTDHGQLKANTISQTFRCCYCPSPIDPEFSSTLVLFTTGTDVNVSQSPTVIEKPVAQIGFGVEMIGHETGACVANRCKCAGRVRTFYTIHVRLDARDESAHVDHRFWWWRWLKVGGERGGGRR